MGLLRFFASLLSFSTFSFHLHLHHALAAGETVVGNDRKALEIIIGGSPGPTPEPENCPPPPPPEPLCPPPPSPPPPRPSSPPPPRPVKVPPPQPPQPPQPLFASELIKKVFPVIKSLQSRIECDPKKILKTWTGTDICRKDKYLGLTCAVFPEKKQLALAGVDFNGFNFSGKSFRLDGFIDKLDEVSIFHVNSNNFVGSVPKMSKLRYLFELDLSNNKLSGDFPMAVVEAKNLTFLDLRFNSFTGSVPPQVFNLDLDVLFINNNNLVQSLPDNLGSITALYLSFANNRFTGHIPHSIGKIKNLREVLFLNNQLSGCLPYEIGYLNQTTVFDVGFNQLTGPIPNSFGCLGKIEQLNLARNQFYGAVPEIVCDLPKLANLSLSYNYFTQVGPVCRKLIKAKRLDIRMNCILDLPNQRSAQECSQFFNRKWTCSNPKSFEWIPCKKNPYRSLSGQELSTSPAQPSVTYGALTPSRG